MANIFASSAKEEDYGIPHAEIPDYSVSLFGIADYILAFIIGFAIGFFILFIFYKITILSIIGGVIFGVCNGFMASNRSITKRKNKLRVQFFDLLEAMSVAMRAGNPPLKALESAKNDLSLIYAKDSDIMKELSLLIGKFHNTVPLSEAFSDFAKRSGLEDVASFSAIYATIEGKSNKTNEIVQETQQIIADKMEIEMEIETMMTAAKSEVNIMLFMPLVVLGVIGYTGGGFMDAIYTTIVGRAVSTGGLIIFIISFLMARKFSEIQL